MSRIKTPARELIIALLTNCGEMGLHDLYAAIPGKTPDGIEWALNKLCNVEKLIVRTGYGRYAMKPKEKTIAAPRSVTVTAPGEPFIRPPSLARLMGQRA